jgi:hypothetical protein
MLPRSIRRLLEGMAPVICPPDVVRLAAVGFVVDGADRQLAASPAHVRAAALLGMRAFGLSARLASLGGESAAAHFDRWWASPTPFRRSVAKAMKALLVIPYFEHPAVCESLRYDPASWIEARAQAWVSVHGSDIERHWSLVLLPDPVVPSAKGISPATS